MVPVRKKSGLLRLSIDLRQLNKAIVPGKYPLPTVEELADEFYGSTIFGKLDLRQGYLQVPLMKDSRDLTTFFTHEGMYDYRFCRMPFGLSSEPSAYQQMMKSTLSGLNGVAVFMDDILVHGCTIEAHNCYLDKVLQHLSERNLTLNEEKCVIAAREVEFLGYSVSAQGMTPLESNVEAVQRVTQPINMTELASFLWATNYYLRSIPSYAEVTTPLRRLLKQGAEWNWSKECQAAFEKLKELVTSAPTLAHFDIGTPIYVICDASGNALGAVLSQIQDGMERPVASASRALSEAEKKYAVGEGEALACMWACERWHIYLYGRKFILRTDHQALTTLLSTNGSGHRPLRLYRWADRLYRYDFTVESTRKIQSGGEFLISSQATRRSFYIQEASSRSVRRH